MIVGGQESAEMDAEGIKLKQVQSFNYLGVQIQNNEKQEAETNERISTPMKIYYTLNRNFLKLRVIVRGINKFVRYCEMA